MHVGQVLDNALMTKVANGTWNMDAAVKVAVEKHFADVIKDPEPDSSEDDDEDAD